MDLGSYYPRAPRVSNVLREGSYRSVTEGTFTMAWEPWGLAFASAEREGGCHPSVKTSRFPLWKSQHSTEAEEGFQRHEGNIAAVSTLLEISTLSKQSPSPQRRNAIYKLTNCEETKPAPCGEVLSCRYGEQGRDEAATVDLVSVDLLSTRDQNDMVMT